MVDEDMWGIFQPLHSSTEKGQSRFSNDWYLPVAPTPLLLWVLLLECGDSNRLAESYLIHTLCFGWMVVLLETYPLRGTFFDTFVWERVL